jgi:hypothetical protein
MLVHLNPRAAKGGDAAVIQYLLQAGANPRSLDEVKIRRSSNFPLAMIQDVTVDCRGVGIQQNGSLPLCVRLE